MVKDTYNLQAFIDATQLCHASTNEQLLIKSYGTTLALEIGKGVSRIDYAFHNNHGIRATSCFPTNHYHIGAHRPLYCSIAFHTTTTAKRTKRFANPRKDINLKNEAEVQKFSTKFKNLYDDLTPTLTDPTIPGELKLLNISCTTVKIVQRNKKNPPKWQFYSPEARASYYELQYVSQIFTQVYTRGINQWSPQNFKSKRDKLLKAWRHQLYNHAGRNNDKFQVLYNFHAEAYGIHYWKDLSLPEIKYALQQAITVIKQRLHSRRRKSLRLKFNERVKHIESERTKGRIKELITFIFGPKKKQTTQEYLIKDGIIINDEVDKANVCKEHFSEWFKAVIDDGNQVNNDIEDPNAFYGTFIQFQSKYSNSNIPEHIQKILFDSIQERPAADKCAHIEEELRKPPSFDEFTSNLKRSHESSAPGLTGLTYNMIKLWPKALIKSVFDIILELWTLDDIPNYWLHRLIALIPKSTVPDINKLRPITLLETIRKLWTSIYTSRISTIFANIGILHPSQHGCLKRVGVDEANIGMLNALESAKELTSELYMVSWDIKQAFDRPPQPAILLGWVRAGIPIDIASKLVRLGIGGNCYIKTDLLLQALQSNNIQVLESLKFSTETGTPQGDPQAALAWNCFIDILLVALHKQQEGRLSFPTHDGCSIIQRHSAFVDDLVTICGTHKAAQHSADIVSGFCNLFAIEISAPKLEAFRIQWGNAHLPGESTILIHSKHWTPHTIQLQHEGSLKLLGMTFDMHMCSTTQFDIIKQQLTAALSICLRARISPDAKLAVIKSSLLPKVIFSAKFASWGLNKYLEIDKIFERAYRRISKNMPTFPAALLYMPPSVGGLGLPMFSSSCNKRKLNLLVRMDQQETYKRNIVQSLLGRGARAQGKAIPIGHSAIINAPLNEWWITSLLQELQQMQASILIHGKPTHNLYSWNIHPPNHGEIASTILYGTIGISTKTEESALPDPIPLRMAQVWLIQTKDSCIMYDIVSFSSDYQTIEYFIWKSVTGIFSVGTEVHICMSTSNPKSLYPIGSQGTHSDNFETIFPPGAICQLVQLSTEKHDPTCLRTTAIVLHSTIKIPLTITVPSPNNNIFEILQQASLNATYMYTDGSHRSPTDMTQNGGVIVMTNPNGTHSCIDVIIDIPCVSVQPIEQILLAMAAIIAPPACTIYSDSQSSVATMKSILDHNYQKDLLSYAINQSKLYQCKNLKWIRSHTEQRKQNRSSWTEHECGNFIADYLANFKWDRHQQEVNLTIDKKITITKLTTIPLSKILSSIMQYNTFSILHKDTIFLGDIQKQTATTLISKYLHDRDIYRTIRINRPSNKWKSREPKVLHSTNRAHMSILQNSLRTKIIYDKHWTTGNQLKHCGADKPCPLCNLGLETQSHLLFDCMHPLMQAVHNETAININSFISKQKLKKPKLSNIIEHLRYEAMIKRNLLMWTGLWSKQMIVNIQTLLMANPMTKTILLSRVCALSKIYTDAAKQIYMTRAAIMNNTPNLKPTPAECNIQRTIVSKIITDFFIADNTVKPTKKPAQLPSVPLPTTTPSPDTITTSHTINYLAENYILPIPKFVPLTGKSITITKTFTCATKVKNKKHIKKSTAQRLKHGKSNHITTNDIPILFLGTQVTTLHTQPHKRSRHDDLPKTCLLNPLCLQPPIHYYYPDPHIVGPSPVPLRNKEGIG